MSQRRTLVTSVAMGVVSVGLCLLLLEATFRLFPHLLPIGIYGASRFDSELGMSVHAAPVIYNKARFVVREPNAEGFLDIDHDHRKRLGVVRIGFFGDSFVEAAQVPFDQVFYRLLPDRIAGRQIDPLGFGISGWGTLHSFLAYKAKEDIYDLDLAVYVFVENDPGDNTFDVKGALHGSANSVFAQLSPLPPGFELTRRIPFEQQGGVLGAAKWVQQRSLLARLVWNRVALLLGHGTALRQAEAQDEMATHAGGIPNQNDLPSSWPAPYRQRAEDLGHRILAAWQNQARIDGCGLIVLYVPRGETQLRGELAQSDTWLPWLRSVTQDLGIAFLDPSDLLEQRLESGDRVYDDHWTPAGHEVIAVVLEEFIASWLREGGRRVSAHR